MSIWYLARATGLVALIAFTVSTALGALASTSWRSRPRDLDRRYLRQMAHRSAAVTGLAMLATHATLILIDAFVNVSVLGAVVPFSAGYRAFAVGLGSISVYLFVAVAVSGALRGRLATSARAARNWRRVHLTAYLGWALSMGHGILAGTDTGTWWTTALYIACGAVVAAAVTVRLRSEAATRKNALTTARTLVRSTS